MESLFQSPVHLYSVQRIHWPPLTKLSLRTGQLNYDNDDDGDSDMLTPNKQNKNLDNDWISKDLRNSSKKKNSRKMNKDNQRKKNENFYQQQQQQLQRKKNLFKTSIGPEKKWKENFYWFLKNWPQT